MNTNEEYENLKVGDVVLFRYGGTGEIGYRCTVSRVTNTQFAAGTHKFRRKNGRPVGGGYRPYVNILSEKEWLEFDRETQARDITNRLRGVDWSKVPFETLAAIDAIYPASPTR